MLSNAYIAPFEAQYQALRTECGVVELHRWSSMAVTGADRQSFLHNFCTNDVKRLTPGASCEAFFTDVKGKLVGHGLVTCRERELTVVMVPDLAAPLIAHLERYVIRDDVQLCDTSADRACLLVAGGAEARETVARLERALANGPAVNRIDWYHLAARPTLLVEVVPNEVSQVIDALVADGAVLCDIDALETVRIESGLPLYGVDFDAENLPQEIGRDQQAINFTKGCYLGQETVARIDALGHVNRQLVGLRFAGADVPPVGTELSHSSATVGRVSSATFSPQLRAPLALAIVRQTCTAPGSRLDSSSGEGVVVKLPVEEHLV